MAERMKWRPSSGVKVVVWWWLFGGGGSVVVVWLRWIHRRALSLSLGSSLSLDLVFSSVIIIIIIFSLFLREIIVCGWADFEVWNKV